MNKLDKLIKNMLLKYPSIFPTRADALAHIYITFGNGFDWDENNDIVSIDEFSGTTSEKMQMEDIEKSVAGATLTESQKILIMYENHKRKFREEHIDYFLKRPLVKESELIKSSSILLMFSEKYSKISQIIYRLDDIDECWIVGALETLMVVKQVISLQNNSSLLGDEPKFATSREKDTWKTLNKIHRHIKDQITQSECE